MADIASSKVASKKKPKKETSSASVPPAPIPIEVPVSNVDAEDKLNGEQAHESAWMKDLSKQIRNINKKINGMAKTDAILAENPGVSLDQLVASRKMNADQKLQAERKPALQAELTQLKNQQEQIRKFEEEQNKKMAMALDELRLQHQQELESVRAAAKPQETGTSKVELRESLLILSQFLRAAAARRAEANDDSDESRAFEGVLLLLYGGDATAVDAAEKLVTGSTDDIPSTEGQMLSVSYAKVKELSYEHSPYAAEEAWIQGVAQSEETAPDALSTATASAPITDPTLVNAGLTEIDDQTNVIPLPAADVVHVPGAAQMDTGAANISAADSWDKQTSTDPMADSWVSVQRDPLETDIHPTGSAPGTTQNWADDTPEATMESMTISNDGFREVRHSRGRAGHSGEQRSRGRGGPRGDRGRGGPRGGRGGDGNFAGGRGGRGGGRGGRGGRGDSGGW